jgi:hypothetical protein
LDHLCVFAAALAIRCLYIGSISGTYFFTHLQTEPQHYSGWVASILGGHAPSAPFEQAPGFPYFWALVASALGGGVASLAYVQAVLGALTCVGLAKIAGDLRGRAAACVAGGLAAVYGPFIYFTGEALPETLFVGICTAAVAVSSRVDDRPRGGRAADVLAGSLWALAFLVRVNLALGLPLIAYDAWRRGGRATALRVLAPWLVVWGILAGVNAAGAHRAVLTVTSGGENLWLGNNALADGVSPFPPEEARSLVDAVMASSGNAVEYDARMSGAALGFVAQQPAKALRLVWKKLVWTWNERELPNASDTEWQEAQSYVFAAAPILPLGFGLLVPLAVAAPFVARGLGRRSRLLGALVAVGVGSSVIFFTNGRFRITIVPALIVWASIALTADWRAWLKERAPRARAVAAAAVAAGAFVAWGDFYGISSYWIPELTVNRAIWERGAGHLEEATASFRRALDAHPGDDVARIDMALTLEQQGKIDEAMQAYVTRLRTKPDDAPVRKAAEAFVERHAREIAERMRVSRAGGDVR